MKYRSLGPVLICLFAFASFAQSANPAPSGALELLQRVSKHYADAKSYRIQEVQEMTTTSEFARQWQKNLLTAMEAPGGKHYFESHSDMGSAKKISDGVTEWIYHIEEKAYTKKSVTEKLPSAPLAYSQITLLNAEKLRASLAALANRYQSAEMLPDADLDFNGQKIPCHRVHLRSADRKRNDPNSPFDSVIWIDKKHETILETEEHSHVFMTSGNARIPREMEIVDRYPEVELNVEISGEVFTFTPPPDAQLLADFPNPILSYGGASLLGRKAPPLKLKAADGTPVALDSFRGKPVLIDLWATWCPPCVEALPKLNDLYQQTKDKGLVFLSIDRDEEAKLANDYLSRHEYHWQNFHDGGDVAGVLGESGIPRTLLIDANGKVIFDRVGLNDDDLRNEIATLGPQYTSVKPKPPGAPCTLAKQ